MPCPPLFAAVIALLLCGAWPAVAWDETEQRMLKSLWLNSLPPLPANASNRVADNPQAARLGKRLFFDKRLSANRQLSCASCHHPDKAFSDGLPVSIGLTATTRNAPGLIAVAFNEWFYWDGRRDSLWSQAITPLEAPEEMGNTRIAVVRFIAQHYREQYEKVFGPLPAILSESIAIKPHSGRQPLPQRGGPYASGAVKADWYQVPAVYRRQVNSVFADIGKAMAAYLRLLQPRENRFDRFVSAVLNNQTGADYLSPDEQAGLKLYLDVQKTQCLNCHNGPLFSNMGFHNIDSARTEDADQPPDLGRYFGLKSVFANEFNCLGEYSDSPAQQCSALRFAVSGDAHALGAFKVPTLRNLSLTAPYFHDGRYATLEQAVRHYTDLSAEQVGSTELQPVELSDEEIGYLVSFLKAL